MGAVILTGVTCMVGGNLGIDNLLIDMIWLFVDGS